MNYTNYAYELIKDIPLDVFEGLTSIVCIGMVTFIAWKGWKTGIRLTSVLLLVEYVFLMFCSTVFFRVASQSRMCDFHPFWSYKAIQEGRVESLQENFMNVVAFIPVGVLLGFMFQGSRFKMAWWKGLLISCSISISIEALQFWFMKGFSELEDMMHNTVGCLIGWFMVKSSRLMVLRRAKR